MKELISTLLFVFSISFISNAADRFWVGGSGAWTDNVNHWSATSNGAPGASVPGVADNAIFDANSGIIASSVVTIDAAVSVIDFNFSVVATTFVFDNNGTFDVTISGSLTSNATGVTFTGTWGEMVLDAAIAGETITSGGTDWIQDFRINGLQIALSDPFTTTGTLTIDDGGADLAGNNLSCLSFLSGVTTTRTIDISNAVVSVTGGTWQIDSTNLTFNSTASLIELGNTAGNASFTGGGLDYDTVRSLSADFFNHFNNNYFNSLELPNSSNLNLIDGQTLTTDSLALSGTCASPAVIQTTPGVVNASILKTGFLELNLFGVDIVEVNGIGGATYNLSSGSVTSSTGWTLSSSNLYWIGDSGNWNDGSNWAAVSGGTAVGCIPTPLDSVFFDANSFTLPNQVVTVDDTAFFKSMTWTGIVGAQSLELDSSMISYGDITFHPNVSVYRNILYSGIRFNEAAELDPNNAALIDVSFLIATTVSTSVVSLVDDMTMTDSSSVLLFNGRFNTLGNDLKTGSIQTINDPTSGADQRRLIFGASEIWLSQQFFAFGDTALVLNAGTSKLFIGDTLGYANALITEGKAFYDVKLNWKPLSAQQTISGNNSFHKLEITPGSKVNITSNSVQTVSDSLIFKGNCNDSIYISTSDLVTFVDADINKTGVNTNVVSQCVNYRGINASGLGITTFFSTNQGSNSNITFNASQSANASFVPDSLLSSFCFGDTVYFTNNSTAFSGNFNDLTFNWYFNDGSTGYYLNPPTDSTYITFEPDTNSHQFLTFDSINVVLEAMFTNFCIDRDTFKINIIKPNISVLTTEPDLTLCPWEEVSHEAFSAVPGTQFEFFINGVSQNTPSANDTLLVLNTMSDQDTISVLAYEEGCVSDTMPSFIYTVYDTPVFTWSSSDADTSICIGDLVSFNASSINPDYEFAFLVNSTPATVYQQPVGTYSTSSLLDNFIVSAIGRDSNSCTDTLSMTFNVEPLPATTLSESVGGNVICAGQNVTFTGFGADQYEFFVNGISVQGPSATSTYSTTSLTGTDEVSVKGISNSGCEQMAPQEYTYIVLPAPTTTLVSSDIDNSICSGTNVTFTASGAIQYQFFLNGVPVQGPSPLSTYSSSGLVNGDVIYVSGTTSGCSANSSSITMTVLTSPTTTLIDDDADNTICAGTAVTFTAGGATNYQFFVNGVSQGAPSPTNTFVTSSLLNGQTVSVIGESNTCTVSQQQTFIVLTNPNTNLFSNDADNIICQGGSITFTGANAAQYQFFVNGSSVQGPAPTSNLVNPALLVGANTVYVIGTAANGCSVSSSIINVTVNPTPTLVVSSSDVDNIICAGQPVTFTATGGDMYQFLINGVPQGAMSGTATFNTSSLTNGQIVSVNGSALGCPSTSNQIATVVNPIPPVALNSTDVDNVFCLGSAVTYTATGANNYQFFVGGVSQGPSSPVNTINSSGFAQGSFVVSVIGESNNCTNNAQLNVVVNPLPTVSVSSNDLDNVICQGQSVTYTGTGAAVYEFFVNGVSQGVASPNPNYTTNALVDADVVSIIGSSNQGCTDNATMAAITVSPIPSVTLTSSDIDNQICLNENVDFTALGAAQYEFFVNGVSQGAPSGVNTFSSATLTNGSIIQVAGETAGCSAQSNTLVFSVFGSPIVFLTNNGDDEICVGETTDLSAAGAANYQFLINGSPVGGFSPVNTFTTPVNNGDVLTVIGETNGCTGVSTSSVTYVVNNFPTITSSSSDLDNIICLNDLVEFTASGAMTYEFQLNGNALQSGANNTFEIETLENGDLIEIIGLNGDCPSVTDAYLFTVNSMTLDLTVASSDFICEGETVTFTASGADQYEFFVNGLSQGALSATNTFVSSTISDNDEVSFSGFNATTVCTQPYQDYILMNVIDAPLVSAQSATTFCEGDSVVLLSNSPYGNQWYLDGNPIAGATDSVYVAYTSGDYSLDITSGGTGDVWSFGQNANGNFGDGNNLNNPDPTAALTTVEFDELSSGYEFVVGVNTAGEVYAWGENNSGQLGNGTYTSSNVPQIVPTLSGIKTVATSESSAMAVTTTGATYVWGNNTNGQLGTGNTAVINFPFLNAALNNIDSISGGRSHFVILRTDGTVWTVGNNDYGQLGQGNLVTSFNALPVGGLSNIVSVGAGEYHSFAINNLGEIYGWGNNGSGQLGLGDITNRLTPTLLPLNGIQNAQGGAVHSTFLTDEGEVYSCGANTFGQLGINSFTQSLVPAKVAISGASMISSGEYSTLVLRNDHSVFGFGNNTEDQLSLTGTAVSSPEHITDLDGVTFIEASRYSSHFIYGVNQNCTSSSITVTELAVPAVNITESNNLLTATTGNSYQWYFNGNPIPGATNQTHLANQVGDYSVEVTFANGCPGLSDAFTLNSLAGLDDKENFGIRVYPVPTADVVTIEVPTSGEFMVVITDQSGRSVFEELVELDQKISINVTAFDNGIYYVTVVQDQFSFASKFVKVDK